MGRRITIKRVANRIRWALRRDPLRFLKRVHGLIHVGANTGQEREIYAKFGLEVLWIEPIPEVFNALKANLNAFPKQRALQYLVTDRDDEDYDFHIANNGGASSSLLELNLHRDIWPDVTFTDTIKLQSATLATLLLREGIDATKYDGMILDTQGSELSVLRGAIPLLKGIRYICCEVADFEAYTGCCQLRELSAFMADHGYRELYRDKQASHPDGGSYFDIVYRLA